ncbi:FAM234B [Branchiostoma lanceolatum]|uniref:FAM234B protein n=1 Tax=Branchiostoma lanceolatum TaxID=7740 RepID=A0A8K0EZ22_BRALA|nr:FAM234B [Branchiostoma lanceolatum]
MAAIKRLLKLPGEGATTGGLRNLPKYHELPQDVSDGEDTEEEVTITAADFQPGHFLPQGNDKAWTQKDQIELKEIGTQKSNGPTKAIDSELDVQVSSGWLALSRTRIACFLFSLSMCVGFFVAMAIAFPCQEEEGTHLQTPPWRVTLSDVASESSVRLYDIDGDGLLDVILGLGTTVGNASDNCLSLGVVKGTCEGGILAYNGATGAQLWHITTFGEVFLLRCGGLDINADGWEDCLATGRMGLLLAFNPKVGEVLWHVDPSLVDRHWNFYMPQLVPDLDGDGVPDLVAAHGGDLRFKPREHNRTAGRLVLLSGTTGRSLGSWVDMPDGHETYMSVVVHQTRDGSLYALFGSGGETIGGSLWAISVPDLYRRVKGLSLAGRQKIRGYPGSYSLWRNHGYNNGIYELYRSSSSKGVILPPALLDMTGDGVRDIVVTMFDSTVAVLNGETLEEVWTKPCPGCESYSLLAPGFFNDDDTLDIMVRINKGTWPKYNSSVMMILDGRTGTELWSFPTRGATFSSPLTLRTADPGRDAFLFWVLGREGPAAEVIQHPGGVGAHVRRRRHGDHGGDDAPSCDAANMPSQELFLVDRDYARTPIRLVELKSMPYYYNYTEEDYRQRKLEEEERFGPSPDFEDAPPEHEEHPSEMDLTEELIAVTDAAVAGRRTTFPADTPDGPPDGNRRRKRRDRDDDRTFPVLLCTPMSPNDRTTGAVGDVDGDGTLDYVFIEGRVAFLKDPGGSFIKMEYRMSINKINLNVSLAEADFVNMQTGRTLYRNGTHLDLLSRNPAGHFRFLPLHQQRWAGYMGQRGDGKV